MKLKITLLGGRVEAFANAQQIDLGVDALLLGLLTAWRDPKPDMPHAGVVPFSNADLTRFTATQPDTGQPNDAQSRIRKAKARLRRRLIAALQLTTQPDLEQILAGAEIDVVLFRQGIERGQALQSETELKQALLLYDDRLFAEYPIGELELEDRIAQMRAHVDGLFAGGIMTLMRLRSPCIHEVVAAKLGQVERCEALRELAPNLLDRYHRHLALHADEIPLRAADVVAVRVIRDASDRPTNLGVGRDLFLGRQREEAMILRHLADEWLVTLTGAGGCGKTALLQHIGRCIVAEQGDQYPDGVWFVDLTRVQVDANEVRIAQQILASLGLQAECPASADVALLNYLQKRRLLLLLDNGEHLERAVTSLMASIGEQCPRIKILATSRLADGGRWGRQFQVLPLALPAAGELADLEMALTNEALQLFQYYRRKLDPGFEITVDNLATVAQLCRLTSGIPLAIKLEAAKNANLVNLVADHVANRFDNSADSPLDDLDDSGTATAETMSRTADRHQSMTRCIFWSYRRLQPEAQVLFRRLALFAGGWTLEQCIAVCATRGIGAHQVCGILSMLCSNSLVVRDERTDRYRLFEPIRSFAQSYLQLSGEHAEITERYLLFCQSQEGILTPVHENRGTFRDSSVTKPEVLVMS